MSKDRPKRPSENEGGERDRGDDRAGSRDETTVSGETPPHESSESRADSDFAATERSATRDTRESDPGRSIPVDDLFELLAQPGNRYILTYLLRADAEVVPYSHLIEHVVESAETPDTLDEDDFRGRIAARLVHSNLPKLAESGLVDVDADKKTVRATEAIQAAVPYLELAMEQSLEADR